MPQGRLSNPSGGWAKATRSWRRSMVLKFQQRKLLQDSAAAFVQHLPSLFQAHSPRSIDKLEREWWKNLVRRVFEPRDRFQGFDDYFAELFAYFAQPEAWMLYPEVAETLPILKNRGLTLDVISNFDSRLLGILEGLGAACWFDHIFVSSRVGYAKPARSDFRHCLGTPRSKCRRRFARRRQPGE